MRFRDILSRHLGAPQVCLGTVASLYATLSLLAHARLVTAPYPSPLYEECIIGLDALPLRPVYRRLSSMVTAALASHNARSLSCRSIKEIPMMGLWSGER